MPSKAYILVRDKIIEEHFGLAIAAVAHAGAAIITKFGFLPQTQEWEKNSFRKVICRVSDEEFARGIKEGGCYILTESALDGQETCLVFNPREEWPNFFKYLKLWK